MAVYTKVTEDEARNFLQAYDVGELTALTPIRQGIENSNYFLDTTAGHYVLTLFEKRVQASDLPFFMQLMQHLAAKGLPCPRPVLGHDGKAERALNGRPACLVTCLTGKVPEFLTPDHCFEVGQALARLHLAGLGAPCQRVNDLGLTAWQKIAGLCAARADEVQPGLANSLQQELQFLAAHWPAALPAGIIHADLFPDNVFFDGNKLCGLFDFYFACHDLLAYDIAITMNAWCFEGQHSFNVTKARALLRGYHGIRPLQAAEIVALPILARAACVRFLVTRLYDWLHPVPDALVKPKNPLDYLQRLRFHQQVQSPAAYGLESHVP
jgi:homoserine kinase type II